MPAGFRIKDPAVGERDLQAGRELKRPAVVGNRAAGVAPQATDDAPVVLGDGKPVVEPDGRVELGQYFALFQQRIAAFRRGPPGARWDGVYTATSK